MKYRNRLPQVHGKVCLTDGGLETVLIFQDGIDLPGFSSIGMVADQTKRDHLRNYYRPFIELALENQVGFVLESPTWRSSHGWSEDIGQTPNELDELNRRAVEFMLELRESYETRSSPIVVSGCVGPRGDGYVVSAAQTVEEATAYHFQQIAIMADAGIDCVSALTLNYVEEAAGVALAAQNAGVPSVISFTVETDGKLVTGQTLKEAVEMVDTITDNSPSYYMINCAHPLHFEFTLDALGDTVSRIGGLRANASSCSHEELDNAEELDIGDPDQLGRDYQRITARYPHISVLGGCCGTDFRHINAIAHYQFVNTA
jgi:S-methylmethionine-dependent homocysteine/selenocysteine methylase